MGETTLWASIRDALEAEIAEGHYRPGDRLPTEAELSVRFGVNRHTVRRAFSAMRERGLVQARRGAGVYVTAAPIDYRIGKRVRFHQNLIEAGHVPAKRPLLLETRAADEAEAEELGIQAGARVHVYEGLSFSSEVPIAFFRSVFPADRFPDLLAAIRRCPSVTVALEGTGYANCTRRVTRLQAEPASATLARHLLCPEGAPLLRALAINEDTLGVAVEYVRTWFVGERVQLVIEGT